MRRAATTLLIGAVVLLSALLVWALSISPPTTEDIDADLKQVRAQTLEASLGADKYPPGLLRALNELRRSTLANTEAMLSQKRLSVLRRVHLTYSVEGKIIMPANEQRLAEIRDEITQLERKSSQSRTNAEQHAAGLIQALSLMTVETNQLALSQLRLKYYSEKYGLPLFGYPSAMPAISPPGEIVRDKDAL